MEFYLSSCVKFQGPIKLEVNCVDPSCCPDTPLTDSIHLESTKTRASVIKLLKRAQQQRSNFDFKASSGSKEIEELVGLTNTERCMWGVDIDDDSISSLKTKVYLGQTVSFSYEPVEEEGSGDGLLDNISSKNTKKGSRGSKGKKSKRG